MISVFREFISYSLSPVRWEGIQFGYTFGRSVWTGSNLTMLGRGIVKRKDPLARAWDIYRTWRGTLDLRAAISLGLDLLCPSRLWSKYPIIFLNHLASSAYSYHSLYSSKSTAIADRKGLFALQNPSSAEILSWLDLHGTQSLDCLFHCWVEAEDDQDLHSPHHRYFLPVQRSSCIRRSKARVRPGSDEARP